MLIYHIFFNGDKLFQKNCVLYIECDTNVRILGYGQWAIGYRLGQGYEALYY